jgi:hypothetical protein
MSESALEMSEETTEIHDKTSYNSLESDDDSEYESALTSDDIENLCRICLQNIGSDKDYKPCNCNQRVHRECIKLWLQSKVNDNEIPSCEICRFNYQIIEKRRLKRITCQSILNHFYSGYLVYFYVTICSIFAISGDQSSYLKYLYTSEDEKIACFAEDISLHGWINPLTWQKDKIALLCISHVLNIVSLTICCLFVDKTKLRSRLFVLISASAMIIINILSHAAGNIAKMFFITPVNENICAGYIQIILERRKWLTDFNINFGTWTTGFLVTMICAFFLLLVVVAILYLAGIGYSLYLAFRPCGRCCTNLGIRLRNSECRNTWFCCGCCFKTYPDEIASIA